MNDPATSRIRVCHLGKYYPPAAGGIESHVRTLAQAQVGLGLSVEVCCINHAAGPTKQDMDGEIPITRFGRTASVGKFDITPDVIRGLARVEADILHLHVPNPTMILGVLAARPRIPLVVTYHSDLIRQRVMGMAFRPFERAAYRHVAAVLTTSPSYPGGSSFLRPYGDRLHLLPHGIDLSPYLKPRQKDEEKAIQIRAEHGRNGPLWLCAGRHVYYKGFINAIRALTRVRGRLILVGDGPENPSLRAEAEHLGLGDRVVFPGELPHYLDLVPYYLAADAFWFPSNARSEAFGLVQVEAMATGCPVINTRIPHSGVDWVCLHEKTGLTVPVNDPLAFADAANRLISEPGLRDRLGDAARLRAIQEFDHRVMAERSIDIYNYVLNEVKVQQVPQRPVLVSTAST